MARPYCGISDFDGLRSRKHNDEVQFYAFDILVSDDPTGALLMLPFCLPRARTDFRHSPRFSRLISAIARSISAIRLDVATHHKRALQRLTRPDCNCCKSICSDCFSKGEVSHETGRCISLSFAGNRLCPTVTRDPPFFDAKRRPFSDHGGETASRTARTTALGSRTSVCLTGAGPGYYLCQRSKVRR
jgi:hypothetical protein